MQSKENRSKKASTFQEIWNGYCEGRHELARFREDLVREIIDAGLCTTRANVFHWGSGHSKPSAPIIREALAQILSKRLGETVTAEQLF